MQIRISADSTCDLSAELLARYDIGITPLHILFDGEARRDGIDCTAQDMFDYTSRTGKLCSTAAVSIADYEDYFGTELQTHDAIVHFTISSDLSSCFQNACAAAEAFPGKVFVIDSRNLSTGIGHLAMDARLLAEEGRSGAEIADILNARKEKLNVSFVLDTLEYLHKGGRCSGVAALGANLLKLKPCIEVQNGTMSVGKKYRGSLKKTLELYIRERLEGRSDIDYRRIFLTDSIIPQELRDDLDTLVRSLGPFEEVLHTQAGSTISGHCGPSCFGILYYNK